MKYDPDNGLITLDSGRELKTEYGHLELSPFDLDNPDPGAFCVRCDVEYGEDTNTGAVSMSELTEAERREIAQAMVLAWAKWGGLENGDNSELPKLFMPPVYDHEGCDPDDVKKLVRDAEQIRNHYSAFGTAAEAKCAQLADALQAFPGDCFHESEEGEGFGFEPECEFCLRRAALAGKPFGTIVLG